MGEASTAAGKRSAAAGEAGPSLDYRTSCESEDAMRFEGEWTRAEKFGRFVRQVGRFALLVTSPFWWPVAVLLLIVALCVEGVHRLWLLAGDGDR